jgi:muramoyltetrapeptide carboxypeptidase LdcA involved in peptidoglycan recycling
MADALRGYTELAGHASMPSSWMHGMHICRYGPDNWNFDRDMTIASVEEIPEWEKLYVVADGKYTDIVVHNLGDALTGVVNGGESYVLYKDIKDEAKPLVDRFYLYNEETEEYEMDAPVEWLLFRGDAEEQELHEENELDVTGRLIGGCIDVIDECIGTPYIDLTGFAERYKEDGLIWFFDNFELTPMGLMYSMNRLKQMGLFDYAKAVVIGRTCFTGDASDDDYLEQLERVFGDMDVPLIWNADIGHTKPSFTLINGSVGHLEFEDGYAELSMELK